MGIMLPNTNGAAVAIFALVSAGRLPAMINFTAGAANILAGCASAKVKTLITSRGFVEKGKLDKLVSAIEESVRIIYLEDVGADVSWVDKLRALIGHRRALAPREVDDPAVILFTSGSEGAPKGVVLSHKNMLANVAQAAACIDFGRTDKVFNVLPIFHCFGLNAGFVLPLVSGVPVYLYPSPLHYKIVPELVYASNATVLFGTDLSFRVMRASRMLMISARYLYPRRRRAREGGDAKYLVGEIRHSHSRRLRCDRDVSSACSQHSDVQQIRHGRPFDPGIEHRLDPVPGVNDGGRLFVRGPNVMLGYLKVDNPGVLQPPQEG